MPIKFQCPICDKVLKTSDEKAGREAKCPGCKQVIAVPYQSDDEKVDEEEEQAAPPPRLPPKLRSAKKRPVEKEPDEEEDDEEDEEYSLPARRSSGRPKSKGKRKRRGRTGQLSGLGDVLGVAFRIYISSFGLCFVATLPLVFVFVLPYFALLFIMVQQQGGGDPGPREISIFLGSILLTLVFYIYFLMGAYRLFLNLVLTGRAEFGDIFSQGAILPSGLGLAFLVYLLNGLCGPFAVIPAFLFFPALICLVDRQGGVGDAMNTSISITAGNILDWFVVALLSLVLAITGVLLAGVGHFFMMPLLFLIWTTVYAMHTGQEVVDPAG